MTSNGIEVSGSHALVSLCHGAEYVVTNTSAECCGGIFLSLETLVSASRVLAGYEIPARNATRLIRAPPPLMARLRNVHQAAAKLAATAPDILAHPEVARVIERELLRGLIACLAEPEKIKTPNPNRQRIMRRFHEVIEENQYEAIYLPEICDAIGVPERTLHTVCVEYRGQSPHRYLWLRRTNLVRRALALADPETNTVTTIANDHGFGELGRFAVEYRVMYGESPSATLRRTSDRIA